MSPLLPLRISGARRLTLLDGAARSLGVPGEELQAAPDGLARAGPAERAGPAFGLPAPPVEDRPERTTAPQDSAALVEALAEPALAGNEPPERTAAPQDSGEVVAPLGSPAPAGGGPPERTAPPADIGQMADPLVNTPAAGNDQPERTAPPTDIGAVVEPVVKPPPAAETQPERTAPPADIGEVVAPAQPEEASAAGAAGPEPEKAPPPGGGSAAANAEAAVAAVEGAPQSRSREEASVLLPFEDELQALARIEPEPQPELQRPPRPELETPSISQPFDAPALDAESFTWPEGTDQAPKEETAAALDYAIKLYTSTVSSIRRQQEQAENAGSSAIESISDAYADALERIPDDLLNADDQITQAFEQAQSAVELAASRADLAILQSFIRARRVLNGAYARGRAAVSENARTAQAQIDAIIADLASDFVNPLKDAGAAGDKEVKEALANLNRWKENIPTRFDPTTGTGMEQAAKEAQLPVVPKLADDVIKQLTDQSTQFSKSITDGIQKTNDSITASVGPTLQKHKEAIGTRGLAQLKKAFQSALESLQQNTNDARQSVEQMRAGLVNQLLARRRSARASLESEASRAVVDARSSAGTGMDTLAEGARQALPLYANTAGRLRDTLVDAGKRGGPHALQKTATNATQSIEATVADAQRAQSGQAELVRQGVRASLERRPEQARQVFDASVPQAEGDFNPLVETASTTLEEAAATQTSGFSKVADGVRETARSWATPLADSFKTYIEDNRKELKKNLEPFKKNVETSKTNFLNWVTPQKDPEKFLHLTLEQIWSPVLTNLESRFEKMGKAFNYGIIDTVDEGGVTGALRGLTRAQGNAMRQKWLQVHPDSYELDTYLGLRLDFDSDDYNAAINYLNGNTAAGARYELEASIHWYGDEESRIEAVMRSLTPDQLKELHKLDGWQSTEKTVRNALGGTDLNVFDALNAGNFARADAYRLREAVEEARQRGDANASIEVLSKYSTEPSPEEWGGQKVSDAERRKQVQREFASIQGIVNVDQNKPISDEQASQALLQFVSAPIEVVRSAGEGETYTETIKIEGAQLDLATALIYNKEGSPEARAARLGIEAQTDGKPDILKLDQSLVDTRLKPGSTEKDRKEALEDRQKVFEIYARKYGGAGDKGTAEQGRVALIKRLDEQYGPESTGGDLAKALVKEDYPSPATASIAMEYATKGVGTNEELIDRFLGRMSRTEIAEMRKIYNASHDEDLYSNLGVYGHGGFFTELSGDDRLRVERELLGQPSNDKERAELAIFTMRQQRSETGFLGKALAGGSLADEDLAFNEQRLAELVGGEVTFVDGEPKWTGNPSFDKTGNYTGERLAEFNAAELGARLSAENYAAAIDNWSNFIATTITIAGAIVATVVTGGAASPLLAAAIIGGAGLAGMAAKRAIGGGRYGWEQAAVDLGQTAVQALTAGVGQKLQMAAELGQLTASPLINKVIIGMATNALNTVGQTALSESTYSKGVGHAFQELFGSVFKGAAVGGLTAAVSHGVEFSPSGREAGIFRQSLGVFAGGAAGRATELSIDSARGAYSGDAGDIFQASLQAGGLNLAQSTGERIGKGFVGPRPNAPRPATPGAPEVTTTAPRPAAPGAPEVTAAAPRPVTPGAPEVTTTAPRPAGTAAPEVTAAAPRPAVPGAPEVTGAAPRPAAPGVSEAGVPPAPRPVTPGAPEVTTPAARAGAPEAPEAVPAAARPAGPEVETPGAPRQPSTGAAEAIPGAAFRGDALPTAEPGPTRARVQSAASELTGSGGPLAGRARVSETDPDVVLVPGPNGKEVPVNLQVRGPRQELNEPVPPPAHFVYNPETGEYTVFVSNRAHPDAIARALAHELAEIHTEVQSPRRTEELPDALRPGGGRPGAKGEQAALTPHDQGRLAELEVLARQIAAAESAGDTRRVAQLRDEAERLVTNLGLAGPGEGTAQRRSLAARSLPEGSPAHALIGEAAAGAETNPFLQRRPPDLFEGLDLLAQQLARARALGNEDLANGVLELTRRRLIEEVEGLVTTPRTERAGAVISEQAIAALKAAGGPRAGLLDEALPLVKAKPTLEAGAPARDPASLDPHQAEAVRRDFGDRQGFQDWPEFRDAFFAARSSRSPSSPEDLAYAFSRWSEGGVIGPEGSVRSLLSTVRYPDAGFEARYRIEPEARPELALEGKAVLRSGETVEGTVAARRQLINERDALLQERNGLPETAAAQRQEIDDKINALIGRINAHSEALGDAAGRQWAGQQPGLKEIPLPRAGANLPDLPYEGPNGRLVLVETKGGDSPLGVRRSADGTHLVEQGARAYLESLGTTMAKSSDPDVARLGNRILEELAKPEPNLDYVHVRQPFNKGDQSLAAPEVGHFDLGRGPAGGAPPPVPTAPPAPAAPSAEGAPPVPAAVAPPGGTAGTASAVARSAFRGDALSEPRASARGEAENLLAPQAASGLLARDPAVASFTTHSAAAAETAAPAQPHLIVATTSGEKVRVRVEVVDDIEARVPPGSTGEHGAPVAAYRETEPGQYTVWLSSRAPEGTFERALAHELTEIRSAHRAGDIPDALRPGGFGSSADSSRGRPQLSPHDRGRLAEVDVLARQVEEAHLAGDQDRAAHLRDETQRLLADLGLVDETRPAQLRREAALAELANRPAAQRLLLGEAQAALENPFLRLPPGDPRGYLDHLLDRLEYAIRLDDTPRQAQVFEQAGSRITFLENQKIAFRGPDGQQVVYSVPALERRAAGGEAPRGEAPRSRLLSQIIDQTRLSQPGRGSAFGAEQPAPRDPADIDPEYAAAVRRVFADQRHFSSWEDFRRQYGISPTAPLAEQLALFGEWARGRYVTPSGRLAALAAASRRAEVLPYFEQNETPRPDILPVSAEDQQAAQARTGRSIDAWVAERRRLIAERNQLEKDLARITDPDQRKVINQQLKGLRGRDIPRASEPLGEAAAIRFALQAFGIAAADLIVSRGPGFPDILFEHPSGRIAIIEAKGGESQPGARLSADGTHMVQQGTRDYLESLAKEMQQPGKPENIRRLGKELEAALLANRVDYYLVRQPFNPDGSLADPSVIKFDVTRGGRRS